MHLKLLKEGPLSEDCPGYVPGLLRRFSAGDRGQFVVSTWRAKSSDASDNSRIVWHCGISWRPSELVDDRLIVDVVRLAIPGVLMMARVRTYSPGHQAWFVTFAEPPAILAACELN
jgi:hypothetical protein